MTEHTPIGLMTESEMETYRLHRRFDRMGRLIGDEAMKTLMNSHVMVIGLGGVGSWSAEALVRSGVGTVSIVDFDEICITNTNRQLHALSGLVGQHKALVLADRLRKINPQATIIPHVQFYNAETADALIPISGSTDHNRIGYVIDAIDNITAKCHLLHRCKSFNIPVVTATGSGGRLDPTQIRVKDLAETEVDPLARAVRKILRQQYGFPDSGPFNIPAVFSGEPVIEPEELHYDQGKGFRCVCPQGQNKPHCCDERSVIMGNASFVTGAFGFACASVVVQDLVKAPASKA